ncbi:MAG: TonB-dependent receptor [Prevotella sp.]|nr:TonB-dependent receptor [Prevotella sp.]MCH3970166.1 TonB-dependent receptor [Prevotella sp.]MCI1685688.1 TonB-dependent receptor [Prevotella sp.]MCI1781520.1 TonB-dependent receptor [Prevotella sp.]MCI1802031.1 TonB-dependent receptor [Prevotella sp.]MCI1816205.1 TonB-dependent receptor [Prevotella sp.]
MRKQLFSVMLILLSSMGVFIVYPTPIMASVVPQAETIRVKGQVVDEQGGPLIGATIRVKGVNSGTTTDLNGNFQVDVSANAILVVSYVGYKDREIAVRGRAIIDPIQLSQDSNSLDQVVVVGYGTQKKADLTGSVSVVNAEEMKKTSNSNISTLLEGKVPGVQITTDGQPGADPTVRIRGVGSFGSTAPLYVVDGVPMGTTIRDFSPNDIASIQVLKDASAGAIYGSRAANGVIIITTKNGQKDQPLKVDYSGYMGVDYVPENVYDVMDADQYSQYIGQACANSNTPLPGGYRLDASTGRYHFMDNTNTDWFSEVFKTGIRQDHNVNFSGGGAHNTYNIALDYFDQKGTLEGAGPNYKRYTARVNNTMDTKFIKFRTSFVYSHSDQDNMGLSNASEYVQGLYGDVTNVLRGTLLMPPTIKAYDPSTWVLDDRVGLANGYHYDAYGYGVYYDNIHGDISASNPLLINNLLVRNALVDRFVGSGSADVDLFKMLSLKMKNQSLHYNINLSYSKTNAKDYTWIPAWVQSNRVYLDKSNERLTEGYRTYSDALIENTLTYDGTIGKHHINLVAGQTYEEENTNTLTGWGIDFPEPYFLQIQNAATTHAESYEYKHALASYFGRLNYNYDEKYLFSAIVRRDGSSRLSKDIRWGTFPSISVGWRFDKEKFFPISHDIVNMFKIRASYGVLGNENIGEYQYQATMTRNNMTYSFNKSSVTGSAISTFVDNNISWEKKKTTDIGLDLAMFNNRLEFTAEWYKNRSEDLLYGVPVPEQAGVSNTTVTMNAASMDNSGFEFSALYRNHDHAMKYEISANLSTLKNKVTSLGFGTDSYISGAYATYVGHEVGKFYGWVYEGIARTQADLNNHATQQGAKIGDCLYKDVSGPDGKPDGVIDEHDQVVLGSGMAKVNFGLNAHLEYKNFDLSIVTYGALNYHVADNIYNSLNSCYGWGNRDVAMVDANKYSEDGSTYISNVPRTYATNNATLAWNDLFSSRMIQNAAYWKIANVELGYNFPDKWFGGIVTGVRAYISAQNLYTFTGYHGYNVDYAGATFTPGYNFCSFPSARSFMCGIHFTF